MDTASSSVATIDARAQIITSILLICLGYLFYSISDAVVKLLGDKFHFSQVLFFSRVGMLAFIVPYGLLRGGRKSFTTRKPGWILIAGSLAVLTGVININALPHIQMTTFYTLVFTSPFWVAVLSAFFLREKLDKEKIAVILVGFAAVLYVFQPGSGTLTPAALMALASALVYSFSIVAVRHMGRDESRVMIACGSAFVGLVVSIPFLPAHFIMPTLLELVYFLLVGVLGAGGMLCVFYAMQHAPSAATVAPFHYTQIAWGAGLGYFLFGDIPDARTMVGAALIIGAGLYLLLSASRKSRAG